MPKKNLTAKLADVEASLKRWQTRLKRATSKVTELDKLRRRYQLALLSEGQPVIATVRVKVPKPAPEVTADLVEVRRQVDAAIETDHLPETDFEKVAEELAELAPKEDPLKVPKFLKRDPNDDALKAMNRRIEERAAERSKKPAKEKPVSRAIAKAMAERDAINKTVQKT